MIETNKTTARLFPEVPNCETDAFWERMERLITLNTRLVAIGASDAPSWLKTVRRLPILERFAAELLGLFLGKTVQMGSVDIAGEPEAVAVY